MDRRGDRPAAGGWLCRRRRLATVGRAARRRAYAGRHAPANGTASAPTPVWSLRIGSGLSSPVVAAGRLIFTDLQGETETVRALETDTGRRLWSVDLDATFHDHLPPGPRAPPLIDGDRVYVLSCRGEFRCLDMADGRTVWRANFVQDFGAEFYGETGEAVGAARHGHSGSPWIEGDRMWVAVGGRPGAGVVCFDKRTGAVKWRALDDPAGYTGPVLAEMGGRRQLLTFTAAALAGLDPDSGATLWRVPVLTSFGRHITPPRAVGDLALVSSHQAGLLAVRAAGQAGGGAVAPAWVAKTNAINGAPFVVLGRYLYGLGPSRRLLCEDTATGDRLWVKENFTGAPLKADWVGLIAGGDRILAFTGNGRLLLFAADPAGFREIAGPVPVCGPTGCSPAWDGRRLYLRDETSLLAIDLSALAVTSPPPASPST